MHDLLSDPCIDMVRRGAADFAIAAMGADMAGLSAQPFCTDDFHLVCHRDHPLAHKRAPGVGDLVDAPFIHLARNTSIRQYLDAALHPTKLRGGMEVEHLATAAALVAANLGITVIPALALFQFRLPELVVRPLPLPGLVRTLYVIRREGRSLSVAAQGLLELLLAHPVHAGATPG
jgi:DNA-binding transcriptional LysR family regulator